MRGTIRSWVVRGLVTSLLAAGGVAAHGAVTAPAAHASGPVDGAYDCPPGLPWESYNLSHTLALQPETYGSETRDLMAGAPGYMSSSGPASMSVVTTADNGVKANDAPGYDTFGLDAVVARAPQHAQVFHLAGDGSFIWIPVDGYTGGDSFSYEYINPSTGACASQSETATIGAITKNHGADDQYTAYANQRFQTPLLCGTYGCGVLTNDFLVTTQSFFVHRAAQNDSIEVDTTPSTTFRSLHGSVTIHPSGYFEYTPDSGFTGSDEFYYLNGIQYVGKWHIHDNTTDSAFSRVEIDVVNPPSANLPVAQNDLGTVHENTAMPINPGDLLANDGGANHVSDIATYPQHGSLSVSTCQGFGCFFGEVTGLTYTPNADFVGKDWFQYYAQSGWPADPQKTVSAWVEIDVTHVFQFPTAYDDSITVQQRVPAHLDVLANDHDPDHAFDAGSIHTSAATGVLNHGDGTFDINAGFSQSSFDFTYSLDDLVGSGNTYTATVHVTVVPNHSVDDAFETNEDTPVGGNLTANDFTVANVALQTPATHGSATVFPDGTFTYSPDPNWNGVDAFIYVNEGDAATVTITVDPVTDAPAVALDTSCVPSPIDCTTSYDPDNRSALLEGQTARLRGFVADPDFDPGTLHIDWGDGTANDLAYPCTPLTVNCAFAPGANTWYVPGTSLQSCGFVPCSQLLFFDVQHVYANQPAGVASGRFTIRATATESTPQALTGSAMEYATVSDVAPSSAITSVFTTPGSGAVTIIGHVSDPAADGTGTATVDWGDGTTTYVALSCGGSDPCPATPLQPPGSFCFGPPFPSCGYLIAPHTYAATGDYTISLTATTDQSTGNTATAVASVIVPPKPDAPTITSTVVRDRRVTLAITAGDDHGAALSTIDATCTSSNGGAPASASVAAAPLVSLTVGGLTNGKQYTCTATDTSANGTSPTSASTARFVPSPTIAVGDASIVEGNSGARNVLIPVTLSRPSAKNVSVKYTLTDGSAKGGSDYTRSTGMLTFVVDPSTGLTPVQQMISVPVYGDTQAEGNETFTVTLANATPANFRLVRAAGTVTIIDDEPTTGLFVGVGDATIVPSEQRATTVTVPVTLSRAAGRSVTVYLATADGSATFATTPTAGGDYGGPRHPSVTFAPGETVKYVTITVRPRRAPVASDRTFTITVVNANATIARNLAIVTLLASP